MEQKTSNEMWTRIINDARFYDGSPQMLMQLISHFEAQGYVLSQKCEQCNVSGVLPLDEIFEKLQSMRLDKNDMEAMGQLQSYGYTDCINDLLEWIHSKRQ